MLLLIGQIIELSFAAIGACFVALVCVGVHSRRKGRKRRLGTSAFSPQSTTASGGEQS